MRKLTKKYDKEDLIRILNRIINSRDEMSVIKEFQNIMWNDENGESVYNLEPEDAEAMLDLALDMDFFGIHLSKIEKESGIKDIVRDKEELCQLVRDSIQKICKS